MKCRNKKYIEWIVAGVGTLILFFFFSQLLPYHLFHREQTQLFLYSFEAFADYFARPAALACLLGDFFTQFFYYIGGGPAIVALTLLLWGVVVYRLFARYIGRWAWIPTLLAVAWEAGRQCGMLYPLSATFALIGGGALALLCRRWMSSSWKAALPIGLIAVATSYYLFGCGMWLTALFLLHRKNSWVALVLLIECCALPATMRRTALFTWSQAYTYPATTWYDTPKPDRERLLAIDTEMYFGHLNKAQKRLSEGELRNSFYTYYYNLLNAKRSQLPLLLTDYYQPAVQGLFLPVAETSTYLHISAANEVWFALGDMTMAEHATLLGMIFSPQHTGTRAIKRLAEIHLINNDDAAAMKYLRLLQNTLCYKKWAEQRIPGQQSDEVIRWLEHKRQFVPTTDILRSSGNVVASLRNLLHTNPENRMALDYLLCYHLLNKDIETFAHDYVAFAIDQIPCRLYAEGLLIYLAGNSSLKEGVKEYQIPMDVLNDFVRYSNIYEANDGHGHMLQADFGKSYWFYYHYATMTP